MTDINGLWAVGVGRGGGGVGGVISGVSLGRCLMVVALVGAGGRGCGMMSYFSRNGELLNGAPLAAQLALETVLAINAQCILVLILVFILPLLLLLACVIVRSIACMRVCHCVHACMPLPACVYPSVAGCCMMGRPLTAEPGATIPENPL